jgi:hypothetical protein
MAGHGNLEGAYSVLQCRTAVKVLLRSLTLGVLLGTPFCVFAQAELPAKMQGQLVSAASGQIGKLAVELISMDGPETAKVKVTLEPATNFHGARCYFGTAEAIATKAESGWTINASS